MCTTEILQKMLGDLIGFIDGDYFLIGGGMLGLIRDHQLIPYDNDLDIMLLPNAKITIPKGSPYKIQKYYMDSKFYDSTKPAYKPKNIWGEYLNYYRKVEPGLNRAQLFRAASKHYQKEKIVPKFSEPFIDIYRLQKVEGGWTLPFWEEEIYLDDEIAYAVTNEDLGFPVTLPGETEKVCERNYGETWKTPIKSGWKMKHISFD